MKKHPTLPNGFGSIRKLNGKRRNPYAVHPPSVDRNENGNYIRPKAICYVPDWYTGFAVLTAWHAGTYKKGMEAKIAQSVDGAKVDLDEFCTSVLANLELIAGTAIRQLTFREVMDDWYEFKHGENCTKQTNAHNDDVVKEYLKPLFDRPFRALSLDDLQRVVNNASSPRKSKSAGHTVYLKLSSLKHVVRVLKEIYAYADIRNLCDKNYAQYLKLPEREGIEEGSPFWDDDLKILWENKQDPTVRSLLIMCYSGFRISAWKEMEINLDQMYFKGGVKTAAGRARIVPIHSCIQELVKAAMADHGIVGCTNSAFSYRMKKTLSDLGLADRSPHDCRHTFSRLCESYKVPEADRKRLLGHSLSEDITNGVYGHRSLEELRASIELIKPPVCV